MSHFVGREEDIRNITGYLDFYTSDVQVVHIVGPPGFGKSTLAMKIGEIFLRNWVSVHYVDVRQELVKDIDTLAQKIVLTMVDLRRDKKLKTFIDLKDKVHNQYSNSLIILDNCDELFEDTKEEFWNALESLMLASPLKHVRYILTSTRHQAAKIGNFRLHAISNLSSEAAIQLLGAVAPSLTDDQKRQIADLTGNVPLALQVIGPIFKFQNAPFSEKVILKLRDNLPRPAQLPTSSIDLAYSYLKPQLKLLCVNLSHFPGSFNKESASFIFSFTENMLDELVQRSLLQSSHGTQRYFFHQLLHKFFQSQKVEGASLQKHFDTRFQIYFTRTLDKIITEYVKTFKLTQLDEEKHNIKYMFALFKRAKHVRITYSGVKVVLEALEINIMQLKFLPIELHEISLQMLAALDFYTHRDQANVKSFTQTHLKVMMLVATTLHKKADTITTLISKHENIDDSYQRGEISANEFTKYYNVLAQYYWENGDSIKATSCHTHILSTIHGQVRHCNPKCDYLSVSIAYEDIGDKIKALDFRELTYQYQLHSLDKREHAKLILDLYNDSSNIAKDKNFSATVIDDVYPYLITANRSDYSEELYYVAIGYFRVHNLEKQVVQLQMRMINNSFPCQKRHCTGILKREEHFNLFLEKSQHKTDLMATCEFKCAVHYAGMAQEAYDRKCYYLAIWSGLKSCKIIDKLGEPNAVLKFLPKYLVALSYYGLGKNYSATQTALEYAVKHTGIAIKFDYFSLELRRLRSKICYILIALNWPLSNPLCYFYIMQDIAYMCAIALTHLFIDVSMPLYYSLRAKLPHIFWYLEYLQLFYMYFYVIVILLVLCFWAFYVGFSGLYGLYLCFAWCFHTRFRRLIILFILLILLVSDLA